MKIAWLTPEIPYPPIGGRNGVFNRIKQLSKYNEIYLFSIAYSEEEKKLENEMMEYCVEVKYYNRNESKIKTLFKSLLAPYSVASRTIPQLKKDLNHLLDREKIDAIIVDFPNMASNIIKLDVGNIYCTLNQHNTEYKRMRDMVKVTNISIVKRVMYYLESFRLEFYEKKIYNKNIFKSVTFFSENDMKVFSQKWKRCEAELKLFPLGANDYEQPLTFEGKHNLLFIGRLDSVAITNVEAVQWFCKEIYEKVKLKVPDIKLIIAGSNPTQEICNLADEHIQIIPNYKELLDVYSKTDCVILPLLSGGGVKGKLLEAVALKKLVITTSVGIEGTKFCDGKHVLLADEADAFADKCIEALLHGQCYISMIENAYQLFQENYNWNAIGMKYNKFLNERMNVDGVRYDC